jgi:hypothetical protein
VCWENASIHAPLIVVRFSLVRKCFLIVFARFCRVRATRSSEGKQTLERERDDAHSLEDLLRSVRAAVGRARRVRSAVLPENCAPSGNPRQYWLCEDQVVDDGHAFGTDVRL